MKNQTVLNRIREDDCNYRYNLDNQLHWTPIFGQAACGDAVSGRGSWQDLAFGISRDLCPKCRALIETFCDPRMGPIEGFGTDLTVVAVDAGRTPRRLKP